MRSIPSSACSSSHSATSTAFLPSSAALPFLPFVRPYIDEATIAAVAEVLRSGWITTGPQNEKFEAALSHYCNGRPVCTFNSGTATLEVALRVAGIGPGDEVITTPLSWVATSNTILHVGATPVFVDIDPSTRNIDLQKVEHAITPRTKAIMPVDLAGLPVNRDELYRLAKTYHLRVIEDAAQSFGSHWKGQRIGAMGDCVSFSFHPNKNLTAIEGGALVLNTEEEAVLARKYRLQGVTRSGFDGMEVDVLGGKFNLTDVAACVGLHQLPHLSEVTAKRQALAQHYFACFEQFSQQTSLDAWHTIELPPADWAHSNWHMFQIVLPLHTLSISRAEYMAQLKKRQIGSGVHYPPIHLFKLYRERGFTSGMYPQAERIGSAILSLPLFPGMEKSDVERVSAAIYEITQCYAR